ncbi:MAG: hypothetical protein JJ992_00780 [Planctomycetes bacterium]|nr:hypothetical protein [Planctomycetota bacterium]
MREPDKKIDPKTSVPASPTKYRPAIAVSVLLHLALIGALFCWYVPTPRASNDGKRVASTSSPDARGRIEVNPPAIPSPPSVAEPDIPPEQIEASIESQIRSVATLSDERKLSELEKNLARLQGIATEESVRDVTATIAGSLGLDAGPAPADERPEGAFDSDTAQIQDVKRVRGKSGQWEYTSVLVDAQGRTQEVSLTAAEGETAYHTFEQLKRYPMAEGIYRQLVMPMIQKMIQAGELTQKAALEAEHLQRESRESSADADPF